MTPDRKLLYSRLRYSFIGLLISCMIVCMCTVCCVIMAPTSVADGGQSSWCLSEIRTAELSAQQSADDHQCRDLCFHSPGAQQHTHKQMQRLISKSLYSVFGLKKNQSTITRFHFGLQYKPPRVVTPVTHSCCSKRPWDVDISLQRHRNVAHAKPNIHPPLSLCKITPRSVGKIGKPSLSCSDCLVTPEYITMYFTLMHEEEHYPKSKWVVWFRLSHLIKGLKSN